MLPIETKLSKIIIAYLSDNLTGDADVTMGNVKRGGKKESCVTVKKQYMTEEYVENINKLIRKCVETEAAKAGDYASFVLENFNKQIGNGVKHVGEYMPAPGAPVAVAAAQVAADPSYAVRISRSYIRTTVSLPGGGRLTCTHARPLSLLLGAEGADFFFPPERSLRPTRPPLGPQAAQ